MAFIDISVIPMVTMYVVTAHISTKRLQKFFMADELKSNSIKMKEENNTSNSGNGEVSYFLYQLKVWKLRE